MSNITITQNSLATVVLADAAFEDGALTFAGAATQVAGTILARDSSTLKFVPFVIGGSTNGNGIPKAILTYDVTAAGAGDIRIRAAVSGQFRKDKLIVAADGTGANITAAILDSLRLYGMTAVSVDELNIADNS
ncbi:MAG: head decoration protein [Marinagarivorans sp.]|nr:head decoration protein [Marinagarivorans sp.]